MSFESTYRDRYLPKLVLQQGQTADVKIINLRNDQSRWGDRGWTLDFEDEEGNAGSMFSSWVYESRDGEVTEKEWVLLDLISKCYRGKRMPEPREYIVDPTVATRDTVLLPTAGDLLRNAVVTVKARKVKTGTGASGREWHDIQWQVVEFRFWNAPDGPDAAEDANANATTGDRSTPEGGGGYAAYMNSAPYGQRAQQQPGAVPYADDADIPF